jgi:hypothetical protein
MTTESARSRHQLAATDDDGECSQTKITSFGWCSMRTTPPAITSTLSTLADQIGNVTDA